MRAKSGFLALFACLAVATFAQNEPAPAFSWGLANIKVDWWGIVPTGPVLKFGYGPFAFATGLRSDFVAKLGVGYESFSIYRDENSRDPILSADSPAIEKPDAQLELGFRQGILPLDSKRDHLVGFGYVNSRVSKNFGPVIPGGTSFSDRYDEAMASVLGGLQLNNSATSPNGMMDGHNVLFEAEWGPSFLSYQGTDFWRAGLRGIEYVPLFDLGGDRNLLSAYLVLAASAKYADGANLPLFVLESTDVRGYQIGLDSKFRASGTVEGRLNLPSLLGASDILPVLFAFVDGGWYQGFADVKAGSTWADAGGPLLSAGGGLAVSVFGFAQPYVSLAVPILTTMDSAGHPLAGSTAYTLGFGFSFHPESVFDWL